MGGPKKIANDSLSRIIVFGCGRLGSMIANEKWKEGRNVVVTDSDPLSFGALDSGFSGETITGDATDVNVLDRVGFKRASEVIIATGDDNINIFLAYLVRQKFCPGETKIVVRLYDADRAKMLENLGVKLILPLKLSFKDYDLINILKGEK